MSEAKRRGPKPFGSRSPEEAEILKSIVFKANHDGESPASIAKELNAKCVPSPFGRRWGYMSVKHVLRRQAEHAR